MKPYLNPVSGKPTKSDVTMLTGGLNTCYDKSMIRDNQMYFMWNLSLHNTMSLTTRSNRTSIAWFLEDKNNWETGEILKMFATSDKTLITIEKRSDGEIHVYELKKKSSFLTKDYIGKIDSSYFYSITECRDSSSKYIFISTNSKLYKMTKDIIETTFEEVAFEETVATGLLANHKNRLFVANGTSLKFSNLREYDNFVIDENDTINTAGEINITNANGDITAIVPYDGKLIIFCERSRHILYGDTPNAELNQFNVVDFDDGLGCVSDETVTICNRQLFWLDTDMSVYRYNGSYTNKISEPYGNDDYASYGGISGIGCQTIRIKDFVMSSYGDYVYLAVTRSLSSEAVNDTLFVYDTKNRVWWAEDGAFSHLVKWETDTKTPFYYRTDYLIGTMYNNDIVILNALQKSGEDLLFNSETRQFDSKKIEYAFETRTWNLGTIKKKKTLTNVWFQADAEAKVGVCDYWGEHNPWDTESVSLENDYLVLGEMEHVHIRHDIKKPTFNMHEGKERQRFIIPRMYMQKINAFSIRVDGTGYGEFYLLEKEWRMQ